VGTYNIAQVEELERCRNCNCPDGKNPASYKKKEEIKKPRESQGSGYKRWGRGGGVDAAQGWKNGKKARVEERVLGVRGGGGVNHLNQRITTLQEKPKRQLGHYRKK